jgi:hypothetical protein
MLAITLFRTFHLPVCSLKKVKIKNIQDYDFACGSLWVQKLVSDNMVGTLTEGVWEQGAEENILTNKRQDSGEDCKMRSFVTCTLQQT